MYPSGFVDKGSGLSVAAFVARVNEIIRAAHADGRLKALSMEWFGTDYATGAGEFDMTKVVQDVK
jgi:ABC-type amino acid transport substrate-binding protein